MARTSSKVEQEVSNLTRPQKVEPPKEEPPMRRYRLRPGRWSDEEGVAGAYFVAATGGLLFCGGYRRAPILGRRRAGSYFGAAAGWLLFWGGGRLLIVRRLASTIETPDPIET
eukprot:scaffold2864_cov77-Isochrysis_galbana.AAC.3